MKPKVAYPLAFVMVVAAMFVTSTSAAIAQTVQVSNPSGPTPVNPGALSATTTILNPGVVSWVHFGDLNITTGDQQNYADFKEIIQVINRYLKNGVNFALLPGDNANDHTESESVNLSFV